jgi:hypothetical protein
VSTDPLFRVVKGTPTEAELAALAVVLLSLTGEPPPLPFLWPRNGAPGLRVRHDCSPLLLMIWGVVSPVPEALADR